MARNPPKDFLLNFLQILWSPGHFLVKKIRKIHEPKDPIQDFPGFLECIWKK
jgi:hypothetical protein